MPSAIEVLPTPGGPTNSKMGPLATDLAAAASARCLSAQPWLVARLAVPLERAALVLRSGRALALGRLGRELAHGQELEHAILHVVEAVVLGRQHLLGVLEIDLVLAARVPRQLADPLEVVADDLGLHAFATDALEARQLALHLFAHLLGQHERFEALFELLDLALFVVVAELFLDRLELLAQVHLALPLAELFLHLATGSLAAP